MMMPVLVDDEAGAPMTMTAGPTVFTAEELAVLALEEEEEAQTQCTGRRSNECAPLQVPLALASIAQASSYQRTARADELFAG